MSIIDDSLNFSSASARKVAVRKIETAPMRVSPDVKEALSEPSPPAPPPPKRPPNSLDHRVIGLGSVVYTGEKNDLIRSLERQLAFFKDRCEQLQAKLDEAESKLERLAPSEEEALVNFKHKLWVNAQVHLTSREAAVLRHLHANNRAVSKHELLRAVYWDSFNEDDVPEERIIDVFICKVRKKLESLAPTVPFITTVWGEGYTLEGSGREFISDALEGPVDNRSRNTQFCNE